MTEVNGLTMHETDPALSDPTWGRGLPRGKGDQGAWCERSWGKPEDFHVAGKGRDREWSKETLLRLLFHGLTALLSQVKQPALAETDRLGFRCVEMWAMLQNTDGGYL